MHVVQKFSSGTAPFSFAVVRVDPSRASLSAAGELDLAAVHDLAATLAVQEAAGRTFIRLDLSQVSFLDCTCLAVLVSAHNRLRAAGGQLILTDVSRPVVRLLTVTELVHKLLTTREPDSLIGGASA